MCKSFASNSCFTQMMKNKNEFILSKWNTVCQITKVSVLGFYCPVNHIGLLEVRQLALSLKIYIKNDLCLLLVYSSHTNTLVVKNNNKKHTCNIEFKLLVHFCQVHYSIVTCPNSLSTVGLRRERRWFWQESLDFPIYQFIYWDTLFLLSPFPSGVAVEGRVISHKQEFPIYFF